MIPRIVSRRRIPLVHYGTFASPPATIPNISGAVSPVGWTLAHFDDFNQAISFSLDGNGDPVVNTGAASYQSRVWYGGHVHTAGLAQTCYVDPTMGGGVFGDIFTQSGSVLSIKARVPTSPELTVLANAGINTTTTPFVSGLLNTSNFLGRQYFYAEASLKFPVGTGMWAAFWALPYDGTQFPSQWPPEIDITEQLGSAHFADNCTIHSGVTSQVQNVSADFGGTVGSDITAGFHTYGCLWVPNPTGGITGSYVASYFDGTLVGKTQGGTGTNTFQLGTVPLFFIIQFQTGSGMGDPNATAGELPQTFDIDWFRVSTLLPSNGSA